MAPQDPLSCDDDTADTERTPAPDTPPIDPSPSDVENDTLYPWSFDKDNRDTEPSKADMSHPLDPATDLRLPSVPFMTCRYQPSSKEDAVHTPDHNTSPSGPVPWDEESAQKAHSYYVYSSSEDGGAEMISYGEGTGTAVGNVDIRSGNDD